MDEIEEIITSKTKMQEPSHQEAILMSTRGVSASILFAAFRSLGNCKVEVYDKSFTSFYEHMAAQEAENNLNRK
jgi:3-mercaptopyruvate sulfurtransferase SseA